MIDRDERADASVPAEPRRAWLHNPFLWAFLIGIVTLTLIRPLLRHEPPPPPVLGELAPFTLVDTRGEPFGSEDLAGAPWIADFIFTRCGSICPRLTAAMAGLQARFAATEVDDVHLVSFSVDPDYDTPEVLRDYGATYGVDPSRWTLLTGDPATVEAVVSGGFKTAIGAPVEVQPGLMDIAHSGKFVLVDGRGRIRGYYDADEPGLDEVYHRALHVLREAP